MERTTWIYVIAFGVLALLLAAVLIYFLFFRSSPSPSPSPPNQPGTPSTVQNLRVIPTSGTIIPGSVTAWSAIWNPNSGSGITYNYTVGGNGSTLQSGSTSNTSFALDTTKVPLNTPFTVSVAAVQSGVVGPAATLTSILPGGAPDVLSVTSLNGVSCTVPEGAPNTMQCRIPARGAPGRETLSAYINFTNAIASANDVSIVGAQAGFPNTQRPQRVLLTTTGPNAYKQVRVDFCDPTGTGACSVSSTFPSPNFLDLYVTVQNALGSNRRVILINN